MTKYLRLASLLPPKTSDHASQSCTKAGPEKVEQVGSVCVDRQGSRSHSLSERPLQGLTLCNSSGVCTALKSDEGVVVVEGLATCPPGPCRSSCLQLQAFHVPDTFCPMISCYPQHHSSTACTTHTLLLIFGPKREPGESAVHATLREPVQQDVSSSTPEPSL